ncbi:MAG: SGNH/GDSL hydrolase family protein [Stenotrophomonas sp.]
MKRLLLALCVLLAGPAAADDLPPLRILLVGNSYLYTNDLPRELARQSAGGPMRLETTLLARPDHGLAEHFRDGRLQRLLEQRWDWVVLQQGPSALPASRHDLIENVARIKALPGMAGTRLALLSAWPQQRHVHMSLEAEASYRLAASVAGACVVPVATAWRLAREQTPRTRLYQHDGVHPTRLGTQLMAAVVRDALVASTPVTEGDATDVERWSEAAIGGEAARCVPIQRQ